VCCLDRPGDLARELHGVEPVCLRAERGRFPFDSGAVLNLRRILRKLARPAVVHSHNLAALQYACLARLGTQIRHVHTEHGSNPHWRGVRNRIRGRVLFRLADRVVAVSETTARSLTERYGLSERRIWTVPNGVAPFAAPGPAETGRLREELGLRGRTPVIGSIGRLGYVKGYDRLVGAFSGILPEYPGAMLVLVGDGPERQALSEQVAGLGLQDRVVFAGTRSDARRLYGLLDLFVLPSRSEGLSLSLLEAMCAGCPVAATDAGESRSVLRDGRYGRVLPPDEAGWPSAIGDALRSASSDDGRAKTLAARTHAMANYSLAACVAAYERLYSEAVSRRLRGTRC
jgi:glycosyltransferase involved in cell wall biosynthesis